MSEPAAGADVLGMRCRADYADGTFVLPGSKLWHMNADIQ